MDNTTVVAIVIAILGSGGLWSFLQWIVETKVKRHSNDLTDIKKKIDNLVTSQDIDKVVKEIQELRLDTEQTKNLSLAIARDRINVLSNKYLDIGYIPVEDYVSYKAIGDSYINAGGNSEIRAKFELVMEDLDVHSKSEMIK